MNSATIAPPPNTTFTKHLSDLMHHYPAFDDFVRQCLTNFQQRIRSGSQQEDIGLIGRYRIPEAIAPQAALDDEIWMVEGKTVQVFFPSEF